MTRSSAVRRTVVAAALVAPLALTSCGTPQAGAAAVVGDRRISVSDVQKATAEIGAYYSDQPVDQKKVLGFLIAAPTIIADTAAAGAGYSADEARAELAAKVPSPSDAGVLVYQVNGALGRIKTLDSAKQEEIGNRLLADIAALKVEVNPRYGTFDPEQLTVRSSSQNWIAPPKSAPAAPAVPDVSPGAATPPATTEVTPAPSAS